MLVPPSCSLADASGTARAPLQHLTASQREDLLQIVVRLNGGKGNSVVSAAVSKELTDLDMGDWPADTADAASFLAKRDYQADPARVSIIVPDRPDYVRNFWLAKAKAQIPLLTLAANKLLSAHITSAAAEQNWSAWGRTYTEQRNSLSIATAERLVYVKANMPDSWLKTE